MFYQLNYPGPLWLRETGGRVSTLPTFSIGPLSVSCPYPVSLAALMGSLIKKRRKRMRKKKHRKLLKRTRVQRRNK